jgi:hypothetical protein
MGGWAKRVGMFNAIREPGNQSVRSLADRSWRSPSSVHRHSRAIGRRDHSPESSLGDTAASRTWLLRLVGATLCVCGLPRGVGAETRSEFFDRRLEGHGGARPAPCDASCPWWSISSRKAPPRGSRQAWPRARDARALGQRMRPSSSSGLPWRSWSLRGCSSGAR